MGMSSVCQEKKFDFSCKTNDMLAPFLAIAILAVNFVPLAVIPWKKKLFK